MIINLGFDLFARLNDLADEQARENDMANVILGMAGSPVDVIVANVI